MLNVRSAANEIGSESEVVSEWDFETACISEELIVSTIKVEEIDGLDIHEHGTNVYND